jgi:cation diffusion facilitator CzcD-associated flavoprotein CzcO
VSVNNNTETIIIGAGAAGLACAACLKQIGIHSIVLEQTNQVGSEWSLRYDKLHLHTPKNHSSLPYSSFPDSYPTYISKNDFVRYLEDYANKFEISPRFNHKVTSIKRNDNSWHVNTASHQFIAKRVIVTTGNCNKPVQLSCKGLEKFTGEILHSSQYKNGKSFVHKKVLIVGFGNSACEIAICLHEHGVNASLSVRNAVNIIPRDIAGIPVMNFVIAESWISKLSPPLTDAINWPLLRLIIGDIRKYGFQKLPYGPITQVVKEKKIPLIDAGTLSLIKQKKIKVYKGIKVINGDRIEFMDGQEEQFDVIISATGYQPAVGDFMEDYHMVSDDKGFPLTSGKESNLPGLYFCGYYVSPGGMIREIGIEAKSIAKAIFKKSRLSVN